MTQRNGCRQEINSGLVTSMSSNQLSFFFLSVSIVIGIPSIRRPLSTYLYDTIKSLLDGMDDADKADTLIFVCVLEVSAPTSS